MNSLLNKFNIDTVVDVYQKRGNGSDGMIEKFFLGTGVIAEDFFHGKILVMKKLSDDWCYGNETSLTDYKVRLREFILIINKNYEAQYD